MGETRRTNTKNRDFKFYMKRIWEFSIKTFNGMALGLFSTLIIGTILGNLGILIANIDGSFWEGMGNGLVSLSVLLKTLTGVGIGVGIAFSLDLKGLRLIGAGIAGGIASGLVIGRPGDPIVEYLCVIFAIQVVRGLDYFVNEKMKAKNALEILTIPMLFAISSYILFVIINSPVSSATAAIGNFIIWATEMQPFFMGIVISVVMGMLLTAPISSAAIAISIGLGGIAGGAAVVGCSVQMLGFAVMSRKDNNIGTIISVGIGTSMLQFKNILKKPVIWLPTIIVSAILGPIATLVIPTLNTPVGSGMGTSGLVGQFETYTAMGNTSTTWLSIILLQIILPIVLVYIVDLIFRKKGIIKPGDLKI